MKRVFDIVKQLKGSNPPKPELKDKEEFFSDSKKVKVESRPKEVIQATSDNHHSLIFYISVAALVVALAGVGAIWWLLRATPEASQKEAVSSDQSTSQENTTEKPAATEQQPSTNIPTPSVPSDTTTTQSIEPEIDKSSIKIRVVNGTGVTGEAAQTKKLLEEAGFKIGSIGNASRRYEQTTIYHKKDKVKEANLVKDALTAKKGVLEESDTVVGVYDVVVAIGKT